MNPDIEDLINREDFEGLIIALHMHEDKNVHKHAHSALAELVDSRAVDPMLRFIKDRYLYADEAAN